MKKLITSLLMMVFGFSLFAAPVSLETVQKIAVNYYKHFVQTKSDYSVAGIITMQKNGINTFYIVRFNAGGFVLVSADDAVIPVLGYSDEGNFDAVNMPVACKEWLNGYSTQINRIVDAGIDNTQTLQQWNKVLHGQFASEKLTVNPLCSTLWDQSPYYNNLCPGGSVTGCVATAMAQIMKKWNYPTTGVGSHTYTDATYGVQTVNFGTTTYAWASMPTQLSGSSTNAQKTAVATLMYHCGVSVNMQYSPSGSGAYSQDIPDALINYFAYQNTAEIKFLANYSSTNWSNMLKGELDAGRPVLYSGDDGTSGHAFVYDGYNSSSQFHFNWGWSGTDNGYYAIGSLNTSGGNWNGNNSAVIRITPPLNGPIADFLASTTTPAVGGSVTFTDYSTNSPTTWNWTFEGGTPSTYTGQTPPAILYSAAGVYQVTLKVTNTNGSDTKIRSQYIHVGGTPSMWIKQNSGFAKPSRGISQIWIVNPNIVWAAAYNGVSTTNPIQEFTKTVNGGTTWTPGTITFTNSNEYGIANIDAFSDQIAYACMFPSLANGGYIVKTTDGGTTWALQSSANFASSWADFVYFFDASNGVCVGDPTTTPFKFMIYTTSNGGTNWTQVTTLPGPTTGETAIVNQFDTYGNNIWFGTSAGRVYRSTDKGLTWASSNTGLGTTVGITPVFKDASTGLAFGVNSSTHVYAGMKKTTNGGANWSAFTPTGFFVQYPNLDFIPGSTNCWVNVASGEGIGSSYSKNDASAFLNIDTGSVQYTCVTMYDMNTGWAGGYNTNAYDGGIYKWQNLITVGIDEQKANNSDIHIYPNPTNGLVNVEFSIFASEKADINVYNLLGEKIYSEEFDPSFNNLLQLDLSHNEPGIYLINVRTGNDFVTKRVLLAR